MNERPFIIGVGGAHSGGGKTTLAAALLRHLTAAGRPTFRGISRWGAIKFTKTTLYVSITDDPSIVARADKDTGALLAAGAAEVLWVQSPAERLGEALPLALERLSSCGGIIVEGNSAIEFLKPDIVIFISTVYKHRIKDSARTLLHRADILVIPEGPGPSDRPAERSEPAEGAAAGEQIACRLFGSPVDEEMPRELVRCMETIQRKKEIAALLQKRSVDGRISCTLARVIADELGAPYREVGETANELKIKIKNCELGCF